MGGGGGGGGGRGAGSLGKARSVEGQLRTWGTPPGAGREGGGVGVGGGEASGGGAEGARLEEAGLQELRGQLRDPSRLGRAVRERPGMRRMAPEKSSPKI